MMFRREFLATQPVYDLNIVIGADEHLFLRMIRERNIRYANLQEELYLYRNHAGFANKTKTREYCDMNVFKCAVTLFGILASPAKAPSGSCISTR